MKDQIAKSLSKASGVKSPHLEFSSRPEFGDYTTNIALGSKNPKETAKKIVSKLNADKSLKQFVQQIEEAGPGFINFHASTKALTSNLSQIFEQKEKYGHSTAGKGEKVIVEYSSPNIAKPFTIGHLRSTIIGGAIANLLEVTGYKVYRDNHLGDWGTQFGKQIYAIKTWGDEKEIEKSANPVKELVALYVKFHEEAEKDPSLDDEARKWFKKLEDRDEEAKRLWMKCIDWSWKEFNKIYEELGVKFTENDGKGYGESYFESKMPEVIEELKAKKLLKKGEDGAELVFFGDKNGYPPLMILKNDGSSLYATRDLATDRFRKEKYGDDITIINEVGIEQTLYFRQLTALEVMLGWFDYDQRIHIGHGHFRFKEGKMSTRKGNVIWLEDVLEESIKRAKKLGSDSEKLSQEVGIGAIKYNDLKRNYKQDIVFDWDEVLNMQGNSGPYLQYTYARTQSVLSKSNKQPNVILSVAEGSLSDQESSVLRDLIKFPEVIQFAAQNYSPNILCEYLFGLAQKYNTFYNKVKIIGSDQEEFLLALTFAVGQILKNGLTLLGIATPEKM
jgi:arginyl-tRNA synthetase